jgi:subtilisin family serine protease
MKKMIWLGLALAAALSCTRQEQIENNTSRIREEAEVAAGEGSPYIPGQVKLCFDDETADLIASGASLKTKAPGLESLMAELGVVSLERVFPEAGEYEARTRAAGLHRFYVAEFATDRPVTKAAGDFSQLPGVTSAAPVRKLERRAFNDPRFSYQWHYVNTRYQNADINVQRVWDNYTTGNASVVVAVVDEGVKYTHEDLADNIWSDNQGHHGYNAVTNNYNITWNRSGDIGHGTHVAGTIGAVSNNGKGVAGVAGGDYDGGIPGVKLMSCQIYQGYSSASDSRTARVIKWAADEGAILMNCSWGYSADYDGNGYVSSWELSDFKNNHFTDPDYADLRAAVDYFLANAGCDASGNQREDSPMKGGLIFFACGNDNIDWDIISSYEPIVAVGSFGPRGTKASYSCYGSFVDVAAPGGDGYSDSDCVWSTVPKEVEYTDYAGSGWQGTSMACPHATGVAALIVSYFGKQGFTADECKDILYGGLGNVIGGSRPVGRKLDAYASFLYGIDKYGDPAHPGVDPVDDPFQQENPNHAPVISLSESSITLHGDETMTVAITASDPDGDELSFSFIPGSEAVTLDEAGRKLVVTGSAAPLGTYRATVKVTDARGLSASASLTYTILLPPMPPVIILQKEVLSLRAHEQTIVHVSAEDPNGDMITVSCQAGSTALTWSPVALRATLVGRNASAGTYTAYFTATDEGGLSSTVTLQYTIFPNHAPEVVSLQENLRFEAPGNSVSITPASLFTDADEEKPDISVSSDRPSVLTAFTQEDGTTLLTAVGYGVSKVTISATDALGASVAQSFLVAVKDPERTLEVFPQPAKENAYVWVESLQPVPARIEVYSKLGNLVLQEDVTASLFEPVNLDVSLLPPGVYTVAVTYEGDTRTEQLITY